MQPAEIWINGDTIHLRFPASRTRENTIKFPADIFGCQLLIENLRARSLRREAKIDDGSGAVLSQSTADAIIAALKRSDTTVAKSRQELQEAKDFLNSIGMESHR